MKPVINVPEILNKTEKFIIFFRGSRKGGLYLSRTFSDTGRIVWSFWTS